MTKSLGAVGAPVEQDILDQFEQVGGNLFVDTEHAGIDDAHVHAGFDRVIEKRRVHRFAHRIVAAKRKRNIADTAADLCQRQVLFNPTRRFNEIDGVIVMLLDAGGDGENIRIENNFLGRESDLLG